MTATCGPTSLRQFAFYDPDGSCWRTWPDISLWGSLPYLGTWPKRGSTRNGSAFERPTLERPTAASGSSSLLPTPDASVAQDGETPTTWLERRERVKAKGINGNGMGMPLTIAVQLLPTPTVGDSKSAANRTSGRSNPESQHHDGLTLTDAARLLPTPTANMANGVGEWGEGSPNLQTSVALLPTPANRCHGLGANDLPAVVQLLPTPQARDGDHTRGADPERYKGTKSQHGRRSNLDDAVAATVTGGLSSRPSDAGKLSSDDQHPTLWTIEDD